MIALDWVRDRDWELMAPSPNEGLLREFTKRLKKSKREEVDRPRCLIQILKRQDDRRSLPFINFLIKRIRIISTVNTSEKNTLLQSSSFA